MKTKLFTILMLFLLVAPNAFAVGQDCRFVGSGQAATCGGSAGVNGNGCADTERCVQTGMPGMSMMTPGICQFDETCPAVQEMPTISCNTETLCGGTEAGGLCPPMFRCTRRQCVPDSTCRPCGERGQPCCYPGGTCTGGESIIGGGGFGSSDYYCCSGTCALECTPLLPWDDDPEEIKKSIGPQKYSGPFVSIDSMLAGVAKILNPLAILLGLLAIIISGYKYMTSQGDPQRIKTAQQDLTAAIVGILFVMLSTAILNIIIGQIIGI